MSLNRYMYVAGNPLRYRDPSGHYEFEDDPDVPYRPPKPPKQKPWWKNVNPPSINKVKVGGDYGDGVIQYGGRWISVYNPPVVKYYPSNPGYYPRYDVCWSDSCLDAPYVVTDFWWGEDYGNVSVAPNARENPVVEGTWKTVDVNQARGRQNLDEFLIGIVMGQSGAPASPAPDPDELGTSVGQISSAVDIVGMIGYGLHGASQMRHTDTFMLQRSESDNYRLIITTTYEGNPYSTFYVSASINDGIYLSPVHLPMIYPTR